MGTTVKYGDISIVNALTLQWDEEAVYDDSHTDQVFNRYRLAFQGLVHVQGVTSSLAPNSSGDATGVFNAAAARPSTASAFYQQIRSCLLEPRQQLTVSFGPDEVLNVDPAGEPIGAFDDDRDVENGPKPVSLHIKNVAGNQCLMVVWVVECAKVECCQGGPVPRVLNNRWTITESMDDNFFTTRTIRGRLRTNDALTALHSYKPMIFPPLETTFRRHSVEFTAQEDGLAADYVVVDKQTKTAAPWPSTKIECEHTEATLQGAEFSSECHVRIDGPPAAATKDLITLAFQICDAKLNINKPNPKQGEPYLQEFRVTDFVGERNSVDMLVRLIRTPADPNTSAIGAMFGVVTNEMGKPLMLPKQATYNPSVSHSPATWGYDSSDERNPEILLYLLTCFLQTPCEDVHCITEEAGIPTLDVCDNGAESVGPITAATVVNQLPPQPTSYYSDSATQNNWRYAKMQSEYRLNPLRVQLPRAGDINGANESTGYVTLGKPQAQRVIKYDAERVGSMPTAPAPADSYQDGEIKGTLLRHIVTPHPATVAPGGQQIIYRVTAEYVYGLNRPYKEGEAALTGALPFVNLDQDANRFDPVVSYDSAIGPGPTPQQGIFVNY